MRKFLLFATISLLAVSCNTDKATIKATITGVKEGELVLKMLQINNQIVVDTIKTDSEGSFVYKTGKLSSSPDFYYLYYKGRKIASLVLSKGEEVYLTADTLGQNQLVEGSQESILLNNLEKDINASVAKFDSLSALRNAALEAGDSKLADSLSYMLGSLYVKSKQAAIKHLYSNPGSITNIILLYQKFPGDLPLFGDMRDVLLFQRVYDSLRVVYPESPYLNSLQDVISAMDRSDALTSKLLDASEVGFPDISMPDTDSKVRILSELSGKVIILLFWSAGDANQKMFNRELLALYDKYSSSGLEIYQVSVDTDKTAWARAVAEQGLPWINVCDGLGGASQAVLTYNVREVPSLFVIDRSGTIAARDIFNSKLESVVSSLIRK